MKSSTLMFLWTGLLILAVWAMYHFQGHETYVPILERVEAAEVGTIELSVQTSAYSSSEDETDDSPTVTASNSTTRKGVVANNCLAFGTKLVIEGEKYVVEDRMNKRYGCDKVDIWMESKELALAYGVKSVTIRVIDPVWRK